MDLTKTHYPMCILNIKHTYVLFMTLNTAPDVLLGVSK